MPAAQFPIPEGPSAAFANVAPGVNTATFGLTQGLAIVTFQAVDANNPGTLTLTDGNGNTVLTMTAPGYSSFMVPAGGASGYYFNATNGANQLAATNPYSLR